MKFDLGVIQVTQSVLGIADKETIMNLVMGPHANNNSEVDAKYPEDVEFNNSNIKNGTGRVLTMHYIGEHKIYIMTDMFKDKENLTWVLLKGEY